MPDNSPMLETWENEPWYLSQKTRWDALIAQGWKFRKPPHVFARVGLTIFRGEDHYTMYLAPTTPQEVHDEALRRCEYHAQHAMKNSRLKHDH